MSDENVRHSMTDRGMPWGRPPLPDGAITEKDRAALAGIRLPGYGTEFYDVAISSQQLTDVAITGQQLTDVAITGQQLTDVAITITG